jgi:hypothetical protein
MSGRTSSNRLAALLLVLSVMVLSASSTQAARIPRHRPDLSVSAIQEGLSIRSLWQNMKNVLRGVVAHHEGPPPGQNPGYSPGEGNHGASREGTGVCPSGRPSNPNPNPGG